MPFERVDDAVRHILLVKARLGLFVADGDVPRHPFAGRGRGACRGPEGQFEIGYGLRTAPWGAAERVA